MKKCPKCGTVLDDSKKKCYMCGADLTASASVSDFSSNFDNKIGSSVTRGIDNVFNNGRDIDVDSSDIVGDSSNNNNGSFFSHNSSSRDFFGGEINKLNSMTFDERSESKKKLNSFFGNDKFKSKDEINSKKKKKKEKKIEEDKVKKISYSTNPNIPKDMQETVDDRKAEEKASKNMFFPPKKEEKVIKSDLMKKDESDVPSVFKSFNSFKNKEDKNSKKKEEFSNNVLEPQKEEPTRKNSFFSSSFGKQKDDNLFDNKGKNKEKNRDNDKLSKEKVNSAFAMFNNNKKDFYNNANDVEVKFSNDKKDSSSNQTDFKGLKESKKNFFDDFKNKTSFNANNTAQMKEIGRMVFNFTCVVAFIGLLIFVYFRYIKIDTTEKLDLLQYRIPTYFKLSITNEHQKFYVSKQHGNSCSFEILSGTPPDPNSYTENYFEYIKNMYASDADAVPTMQEMKLNGNTWKSERIIYLSKTGGKISSDNVVPRYTYTSIVYNGSFYDIKYVNKDEDSECHKHYTTFINSVSFIEGNTK